jgi:hypothetical protein
VAWSLVRLWRRLLLAVDSHRLYLDLRLLSTSQKGASASVGAPFLLQSGEPELGACPTATSTRRGCGRVAIAESSHSRVCTYQHKEGSHDQSQVRRPSVDRLRNHKFRSACKCCPVRRTLAHGRLNYQRPLRRNPYRRWNKPWSNLFYWRKLFRNEVRSFPDSVGRPCFRLRTSPHDCDCWSTHRPWERAV